MTLKRKFATAGTKIRFRDNLKGPVLTKHLGLSTEPVRVLHGTSRSDNLTILEIHPGDVVTVLSPPRVKETANVILLQKEEHQGYMFWIEVYWNAEVLEESC